jgi:hypothetical protein
VGIVGCGQRLFKRLQKLDIFHRPAGFSRCQPAKKWASIVKLFQARQRNRTHTCSSIQQPGRSKPPSFDPSTGRSHKGGHNVRNALMENFRGFNGVMSNVFDAFDRRGPVKYRICRFSRTGVLSSPIFCIQPCSSAPIAVSRTNRNRQVKLPPSTSHQPPINLPSTSHQPPINLPSTCSIRANRLDRYPKLGANRSLSHSRCLFRLPRSRHLHRPRIHNLGDISVTSRCRVPPGTYSTLPLYDPYKSPLKGKPYSHSHHPIRASHSPCRVPYERSRVFLYGPRG